MTIRGLLVAGVLALGLVAAACDGGDTVVSLDGAQPSGIAVSGTGSVTVVPDVARISIGIEVTRPTVAEARTEAADANQAIRDSLKADGVEERDIATQFFNIYPQYQYDEGKAPEIIGFVVTNQLLVKVRNLDSVSAALDGAIEAGGDFVRVNDISFTVDEPERHFTEAREQAVADARQRAEQLAQLAGVSLGAVRSISESTFGGPIPPPMPFAAEGRGGGDTPVSPGEAEVTLTVNVVYEVD